MDKNVKNLFINYGIPSELAVKCEANGLTVSTVKVIPQKDLIAKYGLTKDDAKFVKHAIQRTPIEIKVSRILLQKSNYCCCLCKDSANGYIIHHIEEYSTSQDNRESNLVVLCPNHHNSAHKQGHSLTETIDKNDIREAKYEWERLVEKNNQIKAMNEFIVDIGNIDYCNFKRLEETCIRIFGNIPDTKYSARLKSLKVLNDNNQYNTGRFDANKKDKRNYFDKINEGEGLHFVELIKEIGQKVTFKDLSSNSVVAIAKTLKIGEHVMMIKKLKGKMFPITTIEKPANTKIRNKKRNAVIEVILDSNYVFSCSANERISENHLYVTYGTYVGSEKFIDYKDDNLTKIKISPLIIAFPYIEESEEYDNEYENVDFNDALDISLKDLSMTNT